MISSPDEIVVESVLQFVLLRLLLHSPCKSLLVVFGELSDLVSEPIHFPLVQDGEAAEEILVQFRLKTFLGRLQCFQIGFELIEGTLLGLLGPINQAHFLFVESNVRLDLVKSIPTRNI